MEISREGNLGNADDIFLFLISPEKLLGFIRHDDGRFATDLYERSTNAYS